MPKSTRKTTATPIKPKAQRIMLALNPQLVRVVDMIIAAESLPGVTMSRQDAIRSVLAKLGNTEPFS